jgi:hypothetical protein
MTRLEPDFPGDYAATLITLKSLVRGPALALLHTVLVVLEVIRRGDAACLSECSDEGEVVEQFKGQSRPVGFIEGARDLSYGSVADSHDAFQSPLL